MVHACFPDFVLGEWVITVLGWSILRFDVLWGRLILDRVTVVGERGDI